MIWRSARERAHVLEGLAVALANIDAVIALIKAARLPGRGEDRTHESRPGQPASCRSCWSGPERWRPGRQSVAGEVGLTEAAITSPRCRRRPSSTCVCTRLTGLEQDKIIEEYKELLAAIANLTDILARPQRLTDVVRDGASRDA